MSFLLNEFARDNGSSLRSVFNLSDIKELGDFIRSGMKTADSDGIKIYCGRELITEMPQNSFWWSMYIAFKEWWNK